jgi:hypothetical protein
MIVDKLAEFGEDFDIAEAAGTLLFTNQIDLGAAGRDIGNGRTVYLVIAITESVSTGSSPTINFRLRSDDSAAIHATTSSAHFETGAIAAASLTAGTRLVFALPQANAVPYERYLGLQAVIATATTTTGKASAFLSLDPTGWTAIADAAN